MPKALISQPDLFIASAGILRHKDLSEVMSTNWHSLTKRPRNEPIVHDVMGYKVRITNTHGDGIATIWDHDITIFLISQLVSAINRGETISNQIQFTGYELFRFLDPMGAGTPGKRDYQLLWAALQRLHHTNIKTTFAPTDAGIRQVESSFYWLPHIKQVSRTDGTNVGFVVSIDPFMYEWVKNTKNVLTLDLGYFSIKSALARYIYLWARKSVGSRVDREWSESVKSLHSKSASRDSLKKFLFNLKRLIATVKLPGYELRIELTTKGKGGTFEPTLFAKRRRVSIEDIEQTASDLIQSTPIAPIEHLYQRVKGVGCVD